MYYRATALPSMDWMGPGLCRLPVHRKLAWISDARTLVAQAETPVMRELCESCPVRDACEAFAIAAGVTGGFWAGQWRTDDTPADPMHVEPVHLDPAESADLDELQAEDAEDAAA